jgi:gliding motility-associated-like protein
MSRIILKALFILFALVCFERISAQPLEIVASPAVTGQTYSTCDGILYASGGVSGTGYQNGENWIITLCPDVPGDAITLDFITFNLNTTNTSTPPANNADNFTIYDGNSSSAPSLGTYTGNSLSGGIISASPSNTSGCLTVEFHSNNTGTGVFAAMVTCATPCQRPTAVLSSPIPVAPDTCFKLCVGESLNFNGSPSFAAPGFNIATYQWNFDDGVIDNTSGPIVSHTFTSEGEFMVDLFLFDNNGCASTNLVTVQVLVGTEPFFDGSTTDTSICLGETVCLDGVVTGVLYTGTPGAVVTSAYLPDDVGQCFESTLTYNIFSPGMTLTNINQLLDICVTMEHSFMGDLVASIICPNGQTVILHQQGGGGTNLGEPIDISGPADPIGIPYDYCWSENAALSTWADCAAFGPTPNVMNTPSGTQTLVPDTYSPLNSLSGLVGCPLNGTWVLEFCDLWAADDGWITDWSVNFDPALMPDVTQFTPIYGPNCDSTFWTGTNASATAQISSTSPDCNTICITPNAIGSYTYEFSVTDDFGCTYTTSTTVTVTPGPTIDAGPDQTVCTNVPTQLEATNAGAGTNCNYTFNLEDSFGDGWNGASFQLLIDGVLAGTYTINTGSSATFSVPIPAGASIEIIYTPGTWESEVTYEILDCTGAVVFSDGTFPATGSVYTGTNGLNLVYSWSPTTGLSNPNIANPIATVTQETTYTVTAYENGHPLCGSTDQITLFIDPAVNAGIDGTLTLCYNAAAEDLFPLLTGNPATNGTWFDSGSAAVSNMFDPTTVAPGNHTFVYVVPSNGVCPADSAFVDVTVLGPGDPACCSVSFTSALTDASCAGVCDGTITITSVDATQYSYDGGANFTISNTATGLCGGTYNVIVVGPGGCQVPLTINIGEPAGISVSLTPNNVSCFGGGDGSINSSVSGGSTPYTYTWDNGSTTAVASNLTAGNYCLTVTDDNGCTANDCEVISEPTALSLAFSTTDATCNGTCDGTATAVVGGGTAPYSYNWSGLAGNTSSTANSICDGTYDLIVTDAEGCTISELDWVISEPVALTTVVTAIDETCYGVCDGSITIVSNTGVSFSINGGTTFSANNIYTDLCTGTYEVVVEDPNGCSVTSTHVISGPDAVDAFFIFGPQPANIMNTTISFENLSIGAVSYLWDFGFTLSSDENPIVDFPDDTAGTYNVCLYAYNSANCPDSICFDVIIDEDFVVYVPNSFTPNGDGMNDEFFVKGNDVDPEVFQFMIFNRWGELIFETTDLNEGWDGTEGGLDVPIGIYIWKLKTEAKSQEKYFERIGQVNLIR